jgi:signal transduction histidine kinase
VYSGVVLVLDLVLGGRAQPVVTLTAAGAVAAVVEPMRRRVQRSVDRMLYGDSGDPYAVLARLGRRLEAADSAEGTMSEAVETIARTLRLPYVAVELAEEGPGAPIASFGTSPGAPALVIPLNHGAESVGTLRLGHRDGSTDLSSRENELFQDLARQVALAATAVSLQRALRRSRERLIEARDEERRRLRRDLHDGLGPVLAGVALGVDAARNTLSTDPAGADALLEDLKQEVRGCVSEVRRIVDGLRPPVLDELGLRTALTGFAERVSDRDGDIRVQVQAPESLPRLPAEVELAAYRIAVEAMTNVTRHAHAHSCLVRLSVDDELAVEILDDGVGLPVERLNGVGIGSMTDRALEVGGRCVVSPLDSGGTRVLAHLPLSPTTVPRGLT